MATLCYKSFYYVMCGRLCCRVRRLVSDKLSVWAMCGTVGIVVDRNGSDLPPEKGRSGKNININKKIKK